MSSGILIKHLYYILDTRPTQNKIPKIAADKTEHRSWFNFPFTIKRSLPSKWLWLDRSPDSGRTNVLIRKLNQGTINQCFGESLGWRLEGRTAHVTLSDRHLTAVCCWQYWSNRFALYLPFQDAVHVECYFTVIY